MDAPTPTPQPGPDSTPAPRVSRRARLIGGLLAALALGGTGWLAWHLTHPAAPAGGAAAGPGGPGGPGSPGGRRGPMATTVGVATAAQASIPVTLEALGTVTPQASVKVRPQVSGVLDKVLFKEGQKVRAGDLLATIEARPFELALQQASGQRQRDEAQLDSARVTLQRFKTLLEQDSIARQDVDTQAALVKQLEGTVLIDKASEGTARLNLSYARITAPISGRVGLRTVDVGNVVSSSDANGIALITQVSPIDVVFAVPQDQAGALQQSAAAGTVMTVTALDRTRSATLDTGVFASLDNQVDTTTGTVKVKARFANAALALFPNQFVNVRLQLATIDNAVVVPVTALRHGNDGDYVYVLNAAERTVSLRPVQRGQASADSIQIASGLKAGEQVITEGADRLKDGASVTLPGGGAGGAGGPAGGKKRQRPDGAPRAEGQSGGAASAPAPGSASSAGLANSASPAGPAASSALPPSAADAAALDATSAPRRHRRASQAEGA